MRLNTHFSRHPTPYYFEMMLGIVGVAQVYSDLCLDCHSIVRSYIREDTDKNWSHRPGSLGTR